MNHQAHPKRIWLSMLFLAVLLLFGLTPLVQPAHAASDGWNETIVLDGKFENGQFTLDSNTSQLFRVTSAAPGDSWSGTITISNSTGREMEVALLTIVSQLDDLDLYHALTLELSIGGEVVYSGSYGETPDPITQYYVIPHGDSMEIQATVALPTHIGNEMMGKAMDSIWTFEAHVPELKISMYPYTVKYLEKGTNDELAPTKNGYALLGSHLTEKALSIDGYKPDADEKTIILQGKSNEIIFYYEKVASETPGSDSGSDIMPALIDDEPDPSPSPSENAGVQTGNDLTASNTTAAAYAILAILCVLAAFVIYLQVREAKKRSNIR